LSRTICGAIDVPRVDASVKKLSGSQHTFELVAQSEEKLTSTSYPEAPGTGSQLNCGSKTSSSTTRSLSEVVVVEGQAQENEETAEAFPAWPSAFSGVMFQ
jgi:hypothetical protein